MWEKNLKSTKLKKADKSKPQVNQKKKISTYSTVNVYRIFPAISSHKNHGIFPKLIIFSRQVSDPQLRSLWCQVKLGEVVPAVAAAHGG
jgi:hypothetical protein